MDDNYGLLFENPRKRRRRRRAGRSSRRRSGRSRRRRSNPLGFAANPRRRRRSGRRRGARRSYSRRRRNPFGIGGGGGMFRAVGPAVNLVLAEVVGDVATRAALKFGAGSLLGRFLSPDKQLPFLRLVLGTIAMPIMRMLPLPASIKTAFPAMNIASGIIGITYWMRQQLLNQTGLSDYEVADYVTLPALSGPDYGVMDYEPPHGLLAESGDPTSIYQDAY